jgi:hypothetical protein
LYAHELGYHPRSARQTLSDTVSWLRSGSVGTAGHLQRPAASAAPVQPTTDM